jgi:hypothetical protein
MREGFLTLLGFLLTITPALAQTTVPTTGAYSGSNRRRWRGRLVVGHSACPRGSDFMRRRAQP